ncbi:MAG: ATP-dependent RNA helicase HrpA [Opitutus sp.]|nr:ATP-dependent RNA helicase HrpA [Opitutus sp.]
MSAAPKKPFPFRLEFPPELPISARAEEITAAIQANPVVIIAGETGSGKTTQIPKLCLAAGCGTRGRIACTQPRRVAALSIARRVAEELGVAWGKEVGCKIRFNDHTTSQTVIKFLTDGMLLAEVEGDPLLRDYDAIIIDEAHERSLNIDFLLGHLRTLRFKRPELKIIITSATIDTEAFSAAFDGAPVVRVEGRTYPVEVIYAPLDEFGRDYTDNDENEEKEDASAVASAKAEALHYIDGAVEAVERIVRESDSGDILVFMPAERDIRELGDLLSGRLRSTGQQNEIVPLFGRLSNAAQQRVFAPAQRRKIVLATNIAETSLTIPGIRFVVDSGLARFSRYSPQARTRRLPIEEISQSSADQRKGRSGRVAAGVCIRLYSEKNYLERPRFTSPEIQRANLADVILRLKAFGLGDIERFPFINMPAAKSIRAGYGLLEELGAIVREEGRSQEPGVRSQEKKQSEEPSVESREASSVVRGLSLELTAIGRELARLPVDPTVGRMILQARNEKAVREVLVIAAGLSIQDPRERPLDKQQQADAAHRRFTHPDSDFLTLLNIWDTYHDEFEQLSQAQLRRFCRDHFLSYARMREWRDVHAQLLDIAKEREDFRLTSALHGLKEVDAGSMAFGSPPYRAIHRSILAGLLGNIAHVDEDSGGYKATQDRKVGLFPGSVLFRRDAPKKKPAGAKPPEAAKGSDKRGPRWILASEIMETTRLYARTCARLDPAWALDLGQHVVRVAHSEPFWDGEKGRVMVKRRTRLYGLELESRAVSYGSVDPVRATEIFLREGLVNDTITYPLDCITRNRALREKIEDLLTRARDSGYLNLDEAAYRFYAARLLPEAAAVPVSSVAELVDLVRERRGAEPSFLMMTPDDLRDPETMAHDAASFPEALPLDNRALPLNYAYKPGQADDGVTLEVSVAQAEALTPAALDWAVPGHLEAKVEHYLRALPKELRRGFVPLAETARSLATDLSAQLKNWSGDALVAEIARRGRRAPSESNPTLPLALAAQIRERFGVTIDPAVWDDKPLPDHLRVRVRVVNETGKEFCASRELAEISAALHQQTRHASASVARLEPEAWRRTRAKWETTEQTAWTFGEIPARVLVAEQAGVPVYAFPGLQAATDGVALRLFKTPEEAAAATRSGVATLFERQLSHDLGWLERDLRAVRMLGPLVSTLAPADELQVHAFATIRRWLCGRRVEPLTAAAFAAELDRAKAAIRGLVPRFCDLLKDILSVRQELLVHPKPYAGLDADLATLLPPDFLRVTPYEQLAHLPRYLKAKKLRADRWRQNPAKDAERAGQLAPYEKALRGLAVGAGLSRDESGRKAPPAPARDAFRWLVEEFRVSLFAQELGTAEPVSAVKLERALAALQPGAVGSREAPAPRPIVSSSAVPEKKLKPLKNLGALDRLFPR